MCIFILLILITITMGVDMWIVKKDNKTKHIFVNYFL